MSEPSERERKPTPTKTNKAIARAGKKASHEAKQESRTKAEREKRKGQKKDFAGLFDKRKGKTRNTF